MSAYESKGGASPLVWIVIGLVIGGAGGWWMGELVPYTLFGGLFGWFVGLSLQDSGTGAGEH